jgi:hypothetical protein
MSPRQPFDLPIQRWLVRPVLPAVSQARTRPTYAPENLSLRNSEPLVQVIGGGALLIRAHHFFSRCPGASFYTGAIRPPIVCGYRPRAPVPGTCDHYRPGQECSAVATDHKSLRQCLAYDKSQSTSVLWSDCGPLRVAIARPPRFLRLLMGPARSYFTQRLPFRLDQLLGRRQQMAHGSSCSPTTLSYVTMHRDGRPITRRSCQSLWRTCVFADLRRNAFRMATNTISTR